MQISDEGKIGIALALLGLGGGGALFVLPHPYADYVGWTLIVISVLGLLLLWLHHSKGRRGKQMWPQYLMILSGVLFFVGLFAFLQTRKEDEATAPPKPAEAAEKPATMQTNSASPYADHDKGQWNGDKFIFHEPKHIFTVEVTAADNGRQIPFKVNLPPMASVDLSIKIDPLIFDNRNVQAQFGYKDIRIPWDGISRHSMLAFVPNDQTFYLETLKAIPSNSSIIKVYMNAWWPPKN